MKTFYFRILFPLSLALALFFTSCSTAYNFRYLNKEAIPKDVTKNGYTLLILKYEVAEKDKVGQYFDEHLQKLIADYPYPAVLVTKAELNSSKYADVNKYRYFLQRSDITTSLSDGQFFTEQFFTDRKEGRNYPLSGYTVRVWYQGVKIILAYLKQSS